MIGRFLASIWKNMGTLLLSFILAVAVWVFAVIAEDPNIERDFSRPVDIELVGIDPELVVVGNLPDQALVRLRAPNSLWDELDSNRDLVSAQINLEDYGEGKHDVPLNVIVGISPVRVVSINPSVVSLTIEPLMTETKTIHPVIVGEPALGFKTDELSMSARRVEISGPQSLVSLVDTVQARIDITGTRESISGEIRVFPVDVDGQIVSGVVLSPEKINVIQQVSQAGGYRDVAVKVETKGQLANGYRITNITVFPPTVTVFSSNPELVANMPGFVSTLPLDLSEANDDLDIRLTLDLPEEVKIVGEEQSVQVQIGIAAIESSITISVPVEVIGLGPGLKADVSPATVDVFIFGPIEILEGLQKEDVRIFVNLSGLGIGVHLVVPLEELLSDRITVDAIAPETIEVIITAGEGVVITPTPNPTGTPGQ